MNRWRIIIFGSRTFEDYEFLERKCDFMLQKLAKNKNVEIEIVSGTCDGPDKYGEQYAKKRGYKVKRMPADWDNLGRSAGYLRNKDMAIYASEVGYKGGAIGFWDRKSRGTSHMIDLAKKYKLKLKVFHFMPIAKQSRDHIKGL